MNDYFVSLIRTWVPVAVGAVVTWLAATLGIVLDDDTSKGLLVVATGVVIAVYYAVARLVERQWPGLGKVLVALGVAKAPVYPATVVQGRVEPPARM